MDGRRDVDLDGDRRTIGGLAGRRDKQGIHQVKSSGDCSGRLLTLFGHATSFGRFVARLSKPNAFFKSKLLCAKCPKAARLGTQAGVGPLSLAR